MAFRALWIVTGVLVVLAGDDDPAGAGDGGHSDRAREARHRIGDDARMVASRTAPASHDRGASRGVPRTFVLALIWLQRHEPECESRRFSTHAGSLTLSVTVGRGPGCTDIRMKCFDCKRSLTKATTIWRARRYVGDAWTIVAFCERCRTADFPRRVISGYDHDKPVWKAASYERVPCLTCGAGVVNAVPRYRARTFCSNECATTYRPPRQARGKPMPCSRQPLGTNKVLTRLRRRADG
jgi:hypothetical protein